MKRKMKQYAALLAVLPMLFRSGAALPASAQDYGNTTANITFLPGDLTMEEIAAINFGNRPILGETKEHLAETGNIYLNVQDLRGSGAGWVITAKLSPFVSDGRTLTGAFILFKSGVPTTTYPSANPPVVNQEIHLDAGGDSDEVARASSQEGLGVWSIEWNGTPGDNPKAALSVPGGAATANQYTATITWTMAIVPEE